MPGFNQQGPRGEGPGSGMQRGMCRRTGELDLGLAGGRRMGQGGKGMGGCGQALRNQRMVRQAKPTNPRAATAKNVEEMAEIIQGLEARIASMEKEKADGQ